MQTVPMANNARTPRILSAARIRAACAWLALLPAVAAGAEIPGARGSCTNPDAMARFTLECMNAGNNTLYDCYNVAAQIYCAPQTPTAAPEKHAAPEKPAPPAKKK